MAIEENLDPENWDSMRDLGHRMMDDMFDYLKGVRDRPVWQHAPEDVKQHFNGPIPPDSQPPEEIYKEFQKYVLPYPVGNINPRFWGWVLGTGTVFGALADFLAASINTNTGGLDYHSAPYVEKQLIDWFKGVFGFPASASGVLTGGCSEANLICLAVARNTKAGYPIRQEGIQSIHHRLVVYASEEVHSSIQKAIELLGLGTESLRLIPVNDQFQIDLMVLESTIAQDRSNGCLPICVVGAAGTTNTGAIDDLNSLAQICQRENLWFHVDGAFGAWAILSPQAKGQLAGIEKADSLAFDLHKWMYLPYDIGAMLVRKEEDHRKTFSLMPAYLSHGEGGRGMTGGDLPWFSDYDIKLSRGFRALKAWFSIKEHGILKFGRLIQQNIDQARYLAQLISGSPELELAAPVTLNVVCFRYIQPGLDHGALDNLNKQILVELQEQGIAAPSGTVIRGKFVLHVAHTNHRTLRKDFDILVREVLRIGHQLIQ
jgi:aromatic-L-amino-acid decarboxylase